MDKTQIGLDWLQNQSEDVFCEKTIVADKDHLKTLQNLSRSEEYHSGFAVTPVGSWKIFPKLEDHPDLYEYLEKNTYPYDQPIGSYWMKWYGPGHFAGMHQDQYGSYAQNDTTNSVWYVTSILVDCKNMVGGELVIAGDTSFLNTHVIAERMKVLNITTPGNGACWNQYTQHGVAEILEGERVTLMIAKKSNEPRDPYLIKQETIQE